MLNLELWLDAPDSGSKTVRNLYDLWVVRTKLRRHRKVKKNAHGVRHEDTSPNHCEELSKAVLMDDAPLPYFRCVNFLRTNFALQTFNPLKRTLRRAVKN